MRKKTRILQVTHDLAIGGLQQVVVNLCKTIDRTRFDVEVLCLRALGEFNVLDLLPGIAAPTLVLHCRDDACVPFEQGRLIASRIPRARFVALESSNHVLLPRDPAWPRFVSEVRGFLGCEAAEGRKPVAKPR